MKKAQNVIVLVSLGLCLLLSACQMGQDKAGDAEAYERIVSLSGSITETLFALGHGSLIVGVDVTSTYPEAAVKSLPQLGHVRNLNIEAVLGLQPDLVVAEASDAVTTTLQALEQAGVEVLVLESTHTLEQPMAHARLLAGKLGGGDVLDGLEAADQRRRADLAQLRQMQAYRPKVLFVYARGKGSMMVAGKGTPAEAMIELAGGRNAIEQFEGFQALSAEGLMEVQPDVLLLFESGLASLGGLPGLLQVPGVRETPAGQHGRVIAMDGLYLLGFTPRAAQAAVELARTLQEFNYSQNLSDKGL
jgi:iron complex transport system substrate-binding protein